MATNPNKYGYRNPIQVPIPDSPLTDVGADSFEDLKRIYSGIEFIADHVNLLIPLIPAFYSVTATFGQLINLYNTAGVTNARLASANAAGTLAHGFCWNKAGVAINSWGYVTPIGQIQNLSGLTPGATYYLTNAAGGIALAAGTVSQKLGIAISATELWIRPDLPA